MTEDDELGEVEALPLLLLPSGAANPRYSFSHLVVSETETFNFIALARLEGGLLTAFSKDVWNRVVSKRLLPSGALKKAVLVEVAVAFSGEPDTPDESSDHLKVWIGYLTPEWVARSKTGRSQVCLFNPYYEDVQDGEERIPFGPPLAELVENHFITFHSAPDGPAHQTQQHFEDRMGAMEATLASIQQSLAQLGTHPIAPEPKKGAKEKPPRKSALRPRGGQAEDLVMQVWI